MRLLLMLDGRPPQGLAGEAVFGMAGGTIGRASSCDWVLRDPARLISARHAVVTFENGRFFLVDTSSNGILYNNVRPVGRSNRVQLSSGDRLAIGPFRILARLEDDGTAELPETALAAWSPTAADPGLGDAPGPGSIQRIDPLEALSPPSDDPAPATGGAIPDDFDPLADILRAETPLPRRQAVLQPLAVPPARPGNTVPAPPNPHPLPQAVTPAAPSPADGLAGAERLIPSPDGIGFGGRAILPEARRAAPVTVLDAVQASALAGFWRGLNVGPPPDARQAAMAEALGMALAAVLDHGAGGDWRLALRDGDPVALRRIVGPRERTDSSTPTILPTGRT
ncbi:FHA domain-containing protein (plasmid) [Azospirillum sp. B510]|uniref:type VI secretion system-associated FHA domain protein TagH n=1 Tax=Azospirillum sp. (strain B510) TaxID=137722 RepID=UPI0001C4BCB1|nr:type VI secretion system-associated FHA domain protein TagH [Azospirillum sp. B510]BAI74045.1 FHA domain-containing protein [Azospirillum sp. B510]